MDDPKPQRTFCKAHRKRTGEPCKNAPMNGQKVCRMHGGAGARVIVETGVNIRHGRYAKHISNRLKPDYEVFLNDPDMLNIGSEIALLRTYLADAVSKSDGYASAELEQMARTIDKLTGLVERYCKIRILDRQTMTKPQAGQFVMAMREALDTRFVDAHVAIERRPAARESLLIIAAELMEMLA